MTTTFFGFLSRKPTIYIVGGFWILTNALMFPLLLRLRALSGTMIPDVVPGHDADTLMQIFAAYGTEGMAMYETVAFYDIFYPLSYAIFFGCVMFLLWKNSKGEIFSWIPVLAGLVDYIENYVLAEIVVDVSHIDASLASLSGILVSIKMILIGLTLLLITIGLVGRFWPKKE